MKLKPFVHIAPLPDGVYFGGPNEQFVMGGWSGLYQVADRCAVLLADGAEEDELVSAIGTERARPVIRRMLNGLQEHRMLVADDELLVTVRQDLTDAQQNSLTYLEAMSAQPLEAWERLRSTTLGIIAPHAAAARLAEEVGATGFGQVHVGSAEHAQVVVVAVEQPDQLLAATTEIAAGSVVVPVLLADDLLIAGPGGPADLIADVIPVWERAGHWSQRRHGGRPTRQTARHLAMALAGHLAFDTACGIGEREFKVVYGERLLVDNVALGGFDTDPHTTWQLDEALNQPLPDAEQVVAQIVTVSSEWSGLFTRGAEEETLPQMPLALRQVDLCDGSDRRVVTWGPDQETATMSLAVDAVRRLAGGTTSAGLSAQHWLLDGFLRAVSTRALPSEEGFIWNEEARRVKRALEEHRQGTLYLTMYRVPGIDWHQARLADPDGELLATAWAETPELAAFEVLGTALAREIAKDAASAPLVTVDRTDRITYAPYDRLRQLRSQVEQWLTDHDHRLVGRQHAADPVCGSLPVWAGPVTIENAEEPSA